MTPRMLTTYVQEVLTSAPALSAEQKGVISTALSGTPHREVSISAPTITNLKASA